MALARKPLRLILFKTALEHMRRGAKLMKMHAPGGELTYFVVPGGHVSEKDAEKLKQRPDVHAQNDGLFPGVSQTWHMG
jgi:hypothetical protein